MNIDLSKILHRLLCIYAFLIPFEHILKKWFSIDTILKPYRFLAILSIAVFSFMMTRNRSLRIRTDFQQDIFLYAMVIYGLLISLFYMITTPFSLGRFYNELFQLVLYLGVFFTIKNSDFSKQQLYQILYSLLVGVFLNSIYVFYNFYVLADYTRPKGYMDNPNFLALSVAVTIIVFVKKIDEVKGIVRWGLLFALPFMLYIFIISGSRTASGSLLVAALLLLVFLSSKAKILFLFSVVALSTFVLTTRKIAGPNVLLERIRERDATKDPRIYLWKGVIAASEKTNYVGLGLGQFEARFPSLYQNENHYQIREAVQFGYYLSAHSDYFAILITYGIVGLVSFILFLYTSTRKVVLALLFYKQKEKRSFFELQLILLAALVVFGIASENLGNALYWLLLAFATKSITFLESKTQKLQNQPTANLLHEDTIG
ncbi:MAG: O-antigen ligase family protein [Bacteroidota bacterium]